MSLRREGAEAEAGRRAVDGIRWAARAAMALTALVGAAALFYSTVQPGRLRLLLAAGFVVAVGFAASRRRLRHGAAIWGLAMTALIIWQVQDRPTNNRRWLPEYAVPAIPVREGRSIEVKHIRNFSYSSEVDYVQAYYDAAFPLDGLAAVDLVASYWPGEAAAHVFLTFGFADGRHLAVSIEPRNQIDSRYSAAAELFHHYELFYVVADERDVIGVRTDIHRERVYLYHLNATAQQRQALFLSYMDKAQQLERRPEWYNSMTDNCTADILARQNRLIDLPCSLRALLGGSGAEHAYALGLLDTKKTFADLQDESLIRRPPGAHIGRGYSQEIRRGLSLGDVEAAR